LETLEEINMEAREAFLEAGGSTFHYIACLNEQPAWIDALATLSQQHIAGWPTRAAADPAALEASKAAALAMGAAR
jgi:ferrochelatase